MNHILHNISILMLSLGIILMTMYITKISNPTFLTYEQKLLAQQKELKQRQTYGPDNVYDYRVSKEYKKMFNESESWLGYQTFDENESSQKLYIK